jgi:hypothetical protein
MAASTIKRSTAGTIVVVVGFAVAAQKIFHLADLASGYESR